MIVSQGAWLEKLHLLNSADAKQSKEFFITSVKLYLQTEIRVTFAKSRACKVEGFWDLNNPGEIGPSRVSLYRPQSS